MASGDDRTDLGELRRGLGLAAIALASAVLTATVVIGAGGAWLERSGPVRSETAVAPANPAPAGLIRTSG